MIKFLTKCIIATAVFLILAVLITFISVTAKSGNIAEEKTSEVESALYTLSEYKGKIALYKRGYAMPVEIYEVYISSLPEGEQQKVKDGIEAYTDSEIIKIIEAYTS